MGAKKMHERIQNTGMTKKKIKTLLFSTTQQATNFNNMQTALVTAIRASKRFLRNPSLVCYFIHISLDALPLLAEHRNTKVIGD